MSLFGCREGASLPAPCSSSPLDQARRDCAAESADGEGEEPPCLDPAPHVSRGYCFTNAFLKSDLWYWTDISLLALLPFVLILAGNASIAARLRRSRSDAGSLGR